MRFAKWVFLVAGITGILMVLPLYFVEEQFNRDHPPPITHPEFFYGFVGVALAWQVMFLVIARDPVRYRLAMLPAMLEKASFVGAIVVLYMKERAPANSVAFSMIDATWFVLFIIAYLKTPKQA